MKSELKIKARDLRSEDGFSIKAISKELAISVSTVSLWVRDIQLTKEQQEKLDATNAVSRTRVQSKYRSEIRKKNRQIGADRIKSKDFDFAVGCSLYWGEGRKCKNQLALGNSDPELVKSFVHFLKQSLEVTDDRITLYINCHDDLKKVDEIEKFWCETLRLSITSLRKTMISKLVRKTGSKKKRKLPYGICMVVVNDTSLAQQVIGGIEILGNFIREEWH